MGQSTWGSFTVTGNNGGRREDGCGN